jgi:integrase
MPQLKLTKANIDRVAKPGAKSDTLFWDTEIKGFGLRVTPTGKTTFIAQGRVNGVGDAVRVTVGPYGVFTPDQARDAVKAHLRNMELGVDPRDVKKQDEAMRISLGSVLEAYTSRPGKLKPSTAAEYKRHVEKVFATWKDKPIASITREMVQERHREIAEKGLEGKKAAPASANAAFVTLRILINFAMDEYRRADGEPLIARNPIEALKHHWAKLGTRTERYIDRRKIGEVWNKLHDMRGEVAGYEALASVDLAIFALLCGARRDEMATLTWDRVNIDDHDSSNCWWHLDDRKRGDPISLPLSSQAVALLKSRPRLKLEDGTDSPFVFPSWGRTGRIMDARAPMEAISKICGKRLSLHDLRRTFTNIAMRECRIGKFETDMLTGHKPAQEDVTARNYLNLTNLHEWLTDEVQKIGNWIEQQAAIAASKNVVALPQPQRA